jgi:hypothetical protein
VLAADNSNYSNNNSDNKAASLVEPEIERMAMAILGQNLW